jgi:putative ABC transport system ATP-binding protein
MEQQAILELKNIGKTFATASGPLTILKDVNCVINAGETVAIIGPSGSGKSTLLSLIGLLDTPSEGNIYIDGVEAGALTESAQAVFRNEKIGFIFQSFELISPFTVSENIVAPIEIGNGDVSKVDQAALIERLGLSARAHALPQTLSGGEKQRVAIGRALLNQPAIILADEPTGSLDRATGERVLTLLLESVREQNATLIIITHDESIANKMDRVFALKDNTLHER